jgi:hypothetical protein
MQISTRRQQKLGDLGGSFLAVDLDEGAPARDLRRGSFGALGDLGRDGLGEGFPARKLQGAWRARRREGRERAGREKDGGK